MFVTQGTSISSNRILMVLQFKRNKHYVAVPMMTSQILKSVGFTKTNKSRFYENETSFLQIKKSISYTSTATLWQKKKKKKKKKNCSGSNL